jgi:hypothetical protein
MDTRILNDTILVPTAVIDQINEMQISSAECLEEKGRLDFHLRGSREKWHENDQTQGYYKRNRHFQCCINTKLFSQNTYKIRKNAWEKNFIFPPRYYANCVSTSLTVLILHKVESVYFFYSNPVLYR